MRGVHTCEGYSTGTRGVVALTTLPFSFLASPSQLKISVSSICVLHNSIVDEVASAKRAGLLDQTYT